MNTATAARTVELVDVTTRREMLQRLIHIPTATLVSGLVAIDFAYTCGSDAEKIVARGQFRRFRQLDERSTFLSRNSTDSRAILQPERKPAELPSPDGGGMTQIRTHPDLRRQRPLAGARRPACCAAFAVHPTAQRDEVERGVVSRDARDEANPAIVPLRDTLALAQICSMRGRFRPFVPATAGGSWTLRGNSRSLLGHEACRSLFTRIVARAE